MLFSVPLDTDQLTTPLRGVNEHTASRSSGKQMRLNLEILLCCSSSLPYDFGGILIDLLQKLLISCFAVYRGSAPTVWFRSSGNSARQRVRVVSLPFLWAPSNCTRCPFWPLALLSLALFIHKDCHCLVYLPLRIWTLLTCCNSLSQLVTEVQMTGGLGDLWSQGLIVQGCHCF